jgi:hypothetical protein
MSYINELELLKCEICKSFFPLEVRGGGLIRKTCSKECLAEHQKLIRRKNAKKWWGNFVASATTDQVKRRRNMYLGYRDSKRYIDAHRETNYAYFQRKRQKKALINLVKLSGHIDHV